MSRYDYGMRGYRETTRPRREVGPRGLGSDRELMGEAERGGAYRANRVRARYNRDYVYDRPYRGTGRNHTPFAGDREQRIGDWDERFHAYRTIGGTRTSRGGFRPMSESPFDPLQDRLVPGYDRDYGWE